MVKTATFVLLRQKEMENVRFEIKEVDNLPVDPRKGKFKLIT